MAHVRKQIRDAVETAITSLTTTGSRVHASRVYTLKTLPALRLYTNNETIELADLSRPRERVHTLEVIIEGVAKQADTLDDTLDLIIKEVEVALGNSLLSGLVRDLRLVQIEIELGAESETETGLARMTWQAMYVTAEDDPETAL